MKHIRTIMSKEWLEVLRNKLVFSVVIFVPLLMVAIPVAMLILMGRLPIKQSDFEELGRMMNNPLFSGMTPAEAMQSVLASNYLILFLIMVPIITVMPNAMYTAHISL